MQDPRPRRPLVALAGLALVAVSVVLETVAVTVALGPPASASSGIEWLADAILVTAALVPGLLGFALVWWGRPGWWFGRRSRHGVASPPGAEPARRSAAVALVSPAGQVALLCGSVLLSLLIAGEQGPLVALAALSLAAITIPLACALRRAWWLEIVLTTAAYWLLFVGYSQTDAVARLREGAMVFLLPFVLQPLAAAASGLLRLPLWLRARRAATPPAG